jgi:hypothetical protein
MGSHEVANVDMAREDSSSSYEYQQLTTPNAIRLISLLPCGESQTDRYLKCELKVVSLAENPSFVALSYTWGENVFPETLMCEDKVLRITKNLYDALVCFRLPDRALLIWVDAVCINQVDDLEKSLQIPLMAQIYSQATEVLIWLGEETEESKSIMLYLKRIGQSFVDRGGEILEPRDERSTENDKIWADVTGDPNLEKTDLLLKRPWFSRRWVIQEMALAQRAVVHCGTVSMDWDVLFHACTALGRLRCDGSQYWNKATGKVLQIGARTLLNVWRLDNIRKQVWTNDSTRELFECLDDARGFDCREAKDRVFALLGIFNRGRSDPFQIDYGKSEAEVYEAFARYCLRHGNTVDILSFAGESNQNTIEGRLNLPSWVPDWRLPYESPTATLNEFRAGHKLSSMVEVDDSSKELLARGMLVDQVCAAVMNIEAFLEPDQTSTWTFLEPAHVPKWYLHVENLFSRVMGVDYGTRREYIAGGDVWEALARTLIIDRTDVIFNYQRDKPDAGPDAASAPLHSEFTGFRRYMLSKLAEPSPAEPEGSQPPITMISYEHMDYHGRVVSLSENRCFYLTKKGYIGLGPKEIQPGDVVCVLAGSSVPYVVRPLRDGFRMIGEGHVPLRREAYIQMPEGGYKPYILRTEEQKYSLIGECYTHGLMSGEVWNLDHVFFEDFRIV